ncbi:BTAD domain-containing putative transcriptional regulator [Streptomyces sp. NPDC001843]|uniref:AfsR/SARP family transcriptional regulator n=1 Tax=Streptomyces sp. NPDC001843 TaxID=3364617 RepID=UPI0036A685FD
MEFRILGHVQIYDDRADVSVVPTGAKQRALLGALVVQAGQVVPVDRLVDELWAERPPANAANALQAHVARLRRLLPPPAPGSADPRHEWLVTRPLGYLLNPGGTLTDAQRFHRLVAEGHALAADDPAGAVDILRQGLALWRGPALEGCGRGAICASEAAQLEESRLVALETLYDTCLRSGLAGEITGELEELTTAHPLRERLYELLMTALHRAGRQAEALATYERARRRLMHELGIEPGPVLRGTMEAILHHRHPGPAPRLPRPSPVRLLPVAAGCRPGGPGGRGSLGGHDGPAGGDGRGAPGLRRRGPSAVPYPDVPDGGDAEAGLLRDEIAQLRHRLERLAWEQRELAERLDRLTFRWAAQ